MIYLTLLIIAAALALLMRKPGQAESDRLHQSWKRGKK